jgi:uncharacterized protein
MLVLDGQTVVFRATHARKIAGHGEHPVVAFQADQLDQDTAAGWSVTTIGTARVLSETEAANYCPTPVRALVRPTAGHHVIALEMQLLTGIRTG